MLGITTPGSYSLWAGSWFPALLLPLLQAVLCLSRDGAAHRDRDGQHRGRSWFLRSWEDQCELTRGSSRGLNYGNQHFIWGLSFSSKHFHLGTSPESVWFVDICLIPAGMRVTAFEVFLSREEQKCPTPSVSPGMQKVKQVKGEQREHQL